MNRILQKLTISIFDQPMGTLGKIGSPLQLNHSIIDYILMNNLLQNSSLDRNETLNTLNQTVLNMIHHKKYPLNYRSINSSHFLTSYKKRKLSTTPSQLIHKSATQKLKPVRTVREWQLKENMNATTTPSMGEHLQKMRERQLQLPYPSGQCFDQVNKKINGYLWQKKKEKAVEEEKAALEKDTFCDVQKPKVQQSETNRPLCSVSKLLKSLRKNLLSQLLNQLEHKQFEPPTILNIKQQNPLLKPIDFYQGQNERRKLAKKYPIKGKLAQDLTKQLIIDMASDLRQNQGCGDDKYNKMRIMANHKKIITLGL